MTDQSCGIIGDTYILVMRIMNRAMYAYEQLLQEPEATIPLRTASLFTVAQLYMVKGNFKKGIDYILRWMDEVEKVTAQSYSLLATAYYQM